MAQRPVWHGHLRLSLVACPVALYTATTTANDVRFHLINPETHNRIRQLTVDAETGEAVERKELLRGYEVERDRYVLLTDEEIRDVRLESTHTMDIRRFVSANDIDRIWWNDPYYLVPDGKAGLDAYIVLREAMRHANRLAIARVVIGTRERVVAIEPRGAGMLVTTLRSHDEVRDDADHFADIPSPRTDAKMVHIAEQIIAQLAGPFDPAAFTDRYEDALRELIRTKQEGEAPVAAPPPQQDNVIDLMEALRRSLETDDSAPKRKKAPQPKPARAAPTRRRRAKAS
jgi:DNA end-binding protein Ku